MDRDQSMKIAFMKLYFHPNHIPEYALFDNVPRNDVVFYGYVGPRIPGSSVEFIQKAEFLPLQYRYLIPETLSHIFFRRPPSTTTPTELLRLEESVRGSDVLISNELYSFITAQCARIRADVPSVRFVVEVWETLFGLPLHWIPSYFNNCVLSKTRSDRFIAHTLRAKEYLKKWGVADSKIAVIYPGVDIETFTPSARSKHDGFRFLFVGRFDEEKGLPLLLRAFYESFWGVDDVELWIRAKGDDSEISGLIQQISRRCKIKVLDFVSRAQLPALMGACDALCLPSSDKYLGPFKLWEEQFGFVLAEAMACGLPIIATSCGAIREVVGEHNLVVAQGDVRSLANAMKLLYRDEQQMREVSSANRDRAVAEFDITKQRQKVGQFLEELA